MVGININIEKYIFVKALTNYDEYVSKLTKVEEYIDLVVIRKIADILSKHNKLVNWETFSDTATEEHKPANLYKGLITPSEISLFENVYIPETKKGIHAIEEIVIWNITSKEKLF